MKIFPRIHWLSLNLDESWVDDFAETIATNRPIELLDKLWLIVPEEIRRILELPAIASSFKNQSVLIGKTSNKNQLSEGQNNGNMKFWDFKFEHTFVRSQILSSKDNDWKWICSAIFIDNKVLEGMSEKNIKSLEKIISTILLYVNHDSTAHAIWLGIQRYEYVWYAIGKSLYSFNFSILEILSAQLHKYIYEELVAINPGFERVFKNAIENFCKLILEWEDFHKHYFNSILKYFLFSLYSHDSDFVTKLQSKYGSLNFEKTKWWEKISKPSRSFLWWKVNWEDFWKIYWDLLSKSKIEEWDVILEDEDVKKFTRKLMRNKPNLLIRTLESIWIFEKVED